MGRRREAQRQTSANQSRQTRHPKAAEQTAAEKQRAQGAGARGEGGPPGARVRAASLPQAPLTLCCARGVFQKPVGGVHHPSSTGHANSPCTIVVGKAHLEKVNAPARPCRMLNSYVFSRKIDFNEDLSGKTRAFDTPAGEGVLGAVLLACCGRGGRVKGPASLGGRDARGRGSWAGGQGQAAGNLGPRTLEEAGGSGEFTSVPRRAARMRRTAAPAGLLSCVPRPCACAKQSPRLGAIGVRNTLRFHISLPFRSLTALGGTKAREKVCFEH